MSSEDRRDLLRILRKMREDCALKGDWGWFQVYDARIRALTEEQQWQKQS
jgi:hypothetical protein